MSGAVRPVYLNPGTQAAALGTALARLGFTVEVLKARAHLKHPCVVVSSGLTRLLHQPEYVYAAPGDDGEWWFWWPSPDDLVVLEPIARLSEVSVTADRIARTRARAGVGRQAS
jgi:hypothetical protein